MQKIGHVFVISAPSGAGKSSLVKALCKLDLKLQLSISHTTRPIRQGETDGIDYIFTSQQQFEKMLLNNCFLEHALVYGNYYGTNINNIKNKLQDGYDIILEIDWQGAKQIKALIPTSISIYIMPPNIDELKKRLIARNTDSIETINNRLQEAHRDISHANSFDYIVINDNFNIALDRIYQIILKYKL